MDSDDDMDEHEKLLNFQACVGVYDERLALTYLKNHGWNLSAAVNTYLTVADVGVGGATPGGTSSAAAATAASGVATASLTAATAAPVPRVSSLSDGFQSAAAILSASSSSSSSSASASASASASVGSNAHPTPTAGLSSDPVPAAHTYTGFHLR
jgi:hypothetical protein